MTKCAMIFFRPVILMLMFLTIGLTPLAGQAQTPCGDIMETTLVAGQHIPVGFVRIENDEQYLYVTYETDGVWLITETHLDVATLPEDLKQTSKGNAIPGQFAYQSEHDPGVTTVTYTIDLAAWPSGAQLYLAAHSVVVSASGTETAWAEGIDFPGKNWDMYVAYQLQTCEPPPEPGIIDMAAATIEVQEYESSITLHLIRTDGSDGQATVTLESSDITATGGDDYVTVHEVVTFEDGETEKTVVVFILDDGETEIDEQFSVSITNVTGAEMGTNTATTCTIVDDDQAEPGVIDMAAATIEVQENAGSITLHLIRSDGSDGQATVTLESSDITATGGDDYITVNEVVTFEDGETEKTIEVSILDDGETEIDEQFSVSITNVTGAQMGTNTATTCTIVDDDQTAAGVINMAAATIEVQEYEGFIALHLIRTDGSDGQATVTLESSDITATGGDDYITVNEVVTFEDGETEKTIIVLILNDGEIEADEQFSVSITNVTGAEMGADTETLCIIIDDDNIPH